MYNVILYIYYAILESYIYRNSDNISGCQKFKKRRCRVEEVTQRGIFRAESIFYNTIILNIWHYTLPNPADMYSMKKTLIFINLIKRHLGHHRNPRMECRIWQSKIAILQINRQSHWRGSGERCWPK